MISETHAVENYLAKHFGLMGNNEYEETLIRAFHCSSASLFASFQATVVWNLPEVREKTLEGFKARQLAHWVKTHERHLMENGNNGHYIGNKVPFPARFLPFLIDFASQRFNLGFYLELMWNIDVVG